MAEIRPRPPGSPGVRYPGPSGGRSSGLSGELSSGLSGGPSSRPSGMPFPGPSGGLLSEPFPGLPSGPSPGLSSGPSPGRVSGGIPPGDSGPLAPGLPSNSPQRELVAVGLLKNLTLGPTRGITGKRSSATAAAASLPAASFCLRRSRSVETHFFNSPAVPFRRLPERRKLPLKHQRHRDRDRRRDQWNHRHRERWVRVLRSLLQAPEQWGECGTPGPLRDSSSGFAGSFGGGTSVPPANLQSEIGSPRASPIPI